MLTPKCPLTAVYITTNVTLIEGRRAYLTKVQSRAPSGNHPSSTPESCLGSSSGVSGHGVHQLPCPGRPSHSTTRTGNATSSSFGGAACFFRSTCSEAGVRCQQRGSLSVPGFTFAGYFCSSSFYFCSSSLYLFSSSFYAAISNTCPAEPSTRRATLLVWHQNTAFKAGRL